MTILFLVYLLTILLAISEITPISVAALLGAFFTAWFGISNGLFTYEEALGFLDIKLIMLLVGIMIVVETAERSGLFRILGLYTLRVMGGDPAKLFFALGILSAATSLFLSDSAAMLVISAVGITIARILQYDPIPFVISASIMVNLGGTGTLIGSVSNMIIGLSAGFSFNEFAAYLLPCEIMLWFVTITFLYYYYRKKISGRRITAVEIERWRIENWGAVIKSAFILFILLTLLISADSLGISIEAIAVGCAVIALWISGYDPSEIFKGIDWETVFFVTGFLFVVRGLEKAGGLNVLADFIMRIASNNLLYMTILILFLSGITSIFLANIAVALTLTPMVKLLNILDKRPLWAALVLGTNLGGATIPASSIVMVMAIGLLKHEGIKIDLGEFMKVGFMSSMIQLVFSALYLILVFQLVV